MKHVVLGAVAGLASMASAQSASLMIVAAIPTFDGTITTVITLSIYATADFGTHIAGGEFALNGFGNADTAVSMVGSAAAWGALGENDRGYDGNGNHNGLVFGQLIFPPFILPSPDSSFVGGPVLVGTVVVTMETSSFGLIGWDLVAGAGDFVLEVYDEADGSFTQLTSVDFGSVTVSYPAPSSVALLGIGGLVAGRRRR